MRRLFLAFLPIFASAETLNLNDAHETLQEMLRMHVEHREINPLIVQRASKIYLENFDLSKTYFLQSEVDAIFQMGKSQAEKASSRLKKGDLSDFIALREKVEKSVSRARLMREEMEKELTLEIEDLQIPPRENYFGYPKTSKDLKERLKRQLITSLVEEKKHLHRAKWGPHTRAKILQLFEDRLKRREEGFIGQTEHSVALHSLKALAKSLDAHSAYFSPEEAAEMRTSLEKQFEGVGVVLRESIEGVLIVDLVKGGPAEKSGRVEKGDLLVEIEGKDVTGFSYDKVLQEMKGGGKKEIHLGLQRGDQEKLIQVSLTREKIAMEGERVQFTAEPYGEGVIGKINLPSFYEGGHQTSAEKDLREALKKLKKMGDLKGIVIDMRDNGGGFLSQAVKVSSLFIGRGVIVISKYAGDEMRYLRNIDGRLFFDGPIVILTSKASASAAEIVAQALQDYGTAIVVGDERTYGKGTIQYQTVTMPGARSFYKVTVGRYYTASGKSTQIEGVLADVVVPTDYTAYTIGERYLEYPLQTDRVPAAFVDPLSDIDLKSRAWFKRNYLPSLQQPHAKWQKMVPTLKKNSEIRQTKDHNFSLFVKEQEKGPSRPFRSRTHTETPPWGAEDLQMIESVNILKDMIAINQTQD